MINWVYYLLIHKSRKAILSVFVVFVFCSRPYNAEINSPITCLTVSLYPKRFRPIWFLINLTPTFQICQLAVLGWAITLKHSSLLPKKAFLSIVECLKLISFSLASFRIFFGWVWAGARLMPKHDFGSSRFSSSELWSGNQAPSSAATTARNCPRWGCARY